MFAGFGIKGFRSFHGDLVKISPLDKVNLFAGRNNAGKSNILHFLTNFLKKNSAPHPTGLDIPQVSGYSGQYEIAVAVDRNGEEIAPFLARLESKSKDRLVSYFDEVFENPAVRLTDDNLIWIRYTPVGSSGFEVSREQVKSLAEGAPRNKIKAISDALTNMYSGGSAEPDIIRIMENINALGTLPKVVKIEAFRQVKETEQKVLGTSGENLINELHKLQNPNVGPDYRKNEEKFQEINQFVQRVLEDSTAQLRIPHDESTINLAQNGMTLPLEHYGTGIHQVIIIASIATLHSDTLVCIEEPEVHLHPLLQRKLIRYLYEHTNNRYVVATHSAHMLDFENARIFRIQSGEHGTGVTPARTPGEVSDVCFELGYRPSDILQANAIVWVEGPSDRVYVQNWIAHEDSRLIEGIHFSIMFYGGRLLNHLDASDAEISQFIKLRRLNRNIFILIDSDLSSPSKEINATKKRVVEQFESAHVDTSWVTDGYTIENYVPIEILRNSVKTVHSVDLTWQGSEYENPLEISGNNGDGKQPRIDKIKVAQQVCTSWTPQNYTDELKVHISKLMKFIQDANDL